MSTNLGKLATLKRQSEALNTERQSVDDEIHKMREARAEEIASKFNVDLLGARFLQRLEEAGQIEVRA